MPRDPEEIIKRFHSLESKRNLWDIHWSEAAKVVWPQADEFLTDRTPGEKRTQERYDATASMALEKFAAVMESLLTPRQQTWHRLTTVDPDLKDDSEVKDWLELANTVLFKIRNSPKANYYSQMHEGYKSLGTFGNACLFVDEFPDGGIRYKNCHVGQVYVEVDKHGTIDTWYRKYPMSVRAAYQQWRERLPEKIRSSLATDPFKQVDFLHVVMPRGEERDPERKDALGMPWLSMYLAPEDKTVLDEGGYHESPYMYGRYTVNPTEVYGRGPAMSVLPSIKMLQEMKRTFIRAGHKVTDPPLGVPDEGALGFGAKRLRLAPGGINYGAVNPQGRLLVQPIETGARLDITEGMMETERVVINDAFLVTLFQILVESPQMTATEVLIRAQEKGVLIAPTIGRQQSEMLGPQIERELGIAMRQGAIPPPPDVLVEEGEFDIEYESDASRLQRSAELAGADRTIERAVAAGAVDPEALAWIDWSDYIKLSQEVEGAPSSVLRSREEFEAYMEARREAEEAQAGLDKAEQVGKIATDLSNVIPMQQ